MEFFERAHVSKRTQQSSRRNNKSEETVKKQLKQMLYGYKKSDNELIKNSANIENEFEDSTSVSGFSDLNLTHSSLEDDAMHETVSSNSVDDSVSNFVDLTSNKSHNTDEGNQHKSDESGETVSVSSVTDNEDMPLASKDEVESLDSSESDPLEDISFDSSLIHTSTDNESSQSESFDHDGALAAKIMEKLNKLDKVRSVKSKRRKSSSDKHSKLKSENNTVYKGPYKLENMVSDEDIDEVDGCLSHDNLRKNNEFRGPLRIQELESMSDTNCTDDENQSNLHSNSQHNSSTDTADEGIQFVSVTAVDMPNQSLSDILGDYKYSSLPCSSQLFLNSTKNPSLFSTEKFVKDIDNMMSENENNQTTDDIDTELAMDTELDISTAVPDEESTACDTFQTEEESQKELSTESTEPPVDASVRVFYGKNNCILVLKHPTQLYIHGKVKVTALGGTVEVFGHILQDTAYEVYAPNYNYAQYLRTVENENVFYGLFGKLTSAGLTVSEAEDIVTTIGESDCIVCLERLKSQKMDFVENNFTVTDVFSRPSKSIDNCFKTASEKLGCSLCLSKPWKSFEVNSNWHEAVTHGLNGGSRGIVCGGKGTGKSTFLRYYVNKLLAQGPVLLLDLDPGQCEFTVAGNVSATVVTEPLLGPSFTHLRTPEMMLNLGMINTMDNPKRYAAAVDALITHCSNNEALRRLPWIVNTMGMCNAMGLKFITLIILLTHPTFLLQMDSRNAKKRFEFLLYSNKIKNLYIEKYQYDGMFKNVRSAEDLEYLFLLSQTPDESVKNFSLAPRDERYLNFLSYFGELLTPNIDGLLSVLPYEVNIKDLRIGANVKIVEDSLMRIINGKVIALCQHETGDSKVFTLGDKPLSCHGHGLIRGTDWEKGVLYIITPVASARLAAVDTLVYADWVPELRGPEQQLPAGTRVPYRTASAYHKRQLMFAPKRRFNPIQLLKMTRSS